MLHRENPHRHPIHFWIIVPDILADDYTREYFTSIGPPTQNRIPIVYSSKARSAVLYIVNINYLIRPAVWNDVTK